MLQVVRCSVHIYALLLYTAVVVDAHTTKYHVVGIMVGRVHKRSMFCHACFASHNTWPGLQRVYAQSAPTCIKEKVERIAHNC